MNRIRTARGLTAALLALALVAAACGRDDDGGTTGGGTTGGGNGNGEEAVEQLADPAACQNYNGTQGVTEDRILIGNSLPQSGTFAIFDKVRAGIQAYFDYTNAGGGIDGRQLELKSLDDAYLPERTRANVEQLVNTDGVFAMLGNVGTENNQLAQQYFAENGLCVPNLAVATGFPGFGDPAQDPWIINGLPNYGLEAIAFAAYLKDNRPNATVAILSQNDSFGQSYVDAFKAAIEGSDITVVGEQTFDPKVETSPQGQITTLSGSGADTLFLGVTSIPCPNALRAVGDSAWSPLTYVTLTCSSKVLMSLAGDAAENAISTRATYDPADPGSAQQPGVVEFKTEGAKYGLSAEDLDDLNVAAGWGFASYLVQLLRAAPELERASVMNTAWSQSNISFGMNVEGITWNTDGETDPFGYEQLQFVKRTGGQWVPEGEPVDYSSELREQFGR
jgi:branched-chain amino acid transport system substrate-binding protein